MTAITRLSTIIDELANTTVTNQVKSNIVTSFIEYYKSELTANNIDYLSWDNEQKAKFVLTKLRLIVKDVHRQGQVFVANAANAAAVEAAAAAAAAEVGDEPA